MTLSAIINPPQRVQFLVATTDPTESASTFTLFGVLPIPSASSFFGPQGEGVLLEIDATPRQNHRISQRIPQHPVEEGFDVADDVQPNARSLILDCIISDIPPQALLALVQPITDLVNGNTRSSSAWTTLKGMAGETVDGLPLQTDLYGKPFDVLTSLDLYKNMMIEDINLTKSSSVGEAISFSISLREIRIVSSIILQGSNRPVGIGEDSENGRVAPTEASPANTASASSLAGAVNPSWRC